MAGNGYVRQSVADIINGENITAPPLNAEFNALEYAFDGTTGHTHDGSIGGGPKIDLVTSVSGYLPAIHGGNGGRNNVNTVINPTQLDDTSSGYEIGSIWANSGNDKVFVCVDATQGAAVWHQIAAVSPSSQWLPEVTGTVDLGSDSFAFKDVYLTGAVKAATLDGTIGGTAPAPITGTIITANEGFTGDLTGDIKAADGTVIVDNGTDGTDAAFTGSLTGDVTGNLTGDVTGDIRGDVRATDGAVVLNSGSDGTNATFVGSVTGNVTGDLTGNVTGDLTGDVTGDVTGNLLGNTSGTHTGPVDAQNTRVQGVADPEDATDAVSLGYFLTTLSDSADGISASLNAAVDARRDAQSARDVAKNYRDETLGYRNEAEEFRDQASQYQAIATDKAAQVAFLYDSAQYNVRLIGSLI